MKTAKIGGTALKISCIQVKPGFEHEVASEIKEKCKDIGIDNLRLFKGFGHWDLIVLYKQNDFGPLLTTAGPIPGILNSTSYFCFPYRNLEDIDSIFRIADDFIFFAFVFIKINLNDTSAIDKNEEELISFATEKLGSNCGVFGTLGWNEIVYITWSNDLNQISSSLYNLNCKDPNLNRNHSKTLTQLSVCYDILPDLDQIDLDLNDIESNISQVKDLCIEKIGDTKIKESLIPTIYVTAESSYQKNLIKFWYKFKDKFNLQICYGEFDFKVTPKNPITWSDFLTYLLYFRFRYKAVLYNTHTALNFLPTFPEEDMEIDDNDVFCLSQERAELPFSLSFRELEKVFGQTLAPFISNHFYRLNALCQHPIIGSCFNALLNYPNALIQDIKEISRQGKQKGTRIEQTTLLSAMVLSSALEIRQYGSFGNTQKGHPNLGNLGGGVQRPLQAIEFFPKYIISAHGKKWHGFIISNDPKFHHIRDIISISKEALWNPTLWWALYHEIAHVMIEEYGIVNKKIETVSTFLESTNPMLEKYYLDLLTEIAAEILGYELGFFNDFELFMRLVWTHIINIEPKQQKSMDFMVYIIRTFCVKLYSKRFTEIAGEPSISDEQFKDQNFLYEELLKHIEMTKNIVSNLDTNTFDEFLLFSDSKAAANVSYFYKLLPFFQDINGLIMSYKTKSGKTFSPEIEKLSIPNTTKAIDTIMESIVFWGTIDSPEAVLYQFLKRNSTEVASTSQHIAFILTFWNQALQFREDS